MLTMRDREAHIADLSSRLRLTITRIARRLRQQAGGDLSPTMVAALSTIERHGPMTPSELALVESVQRPTATRIAGKLEDAGLISRRPDPEDGRGCLLEIRGEGHDLLTTLRDRKSAYLSSRLAQLSDEETDVLDRASVILERLLSDDPTTVHRVIDDATIAALTAQQPDNPAGESVAP